MITWLRRANTNLLFNTSRACFSNFPKSSDFLSEKRQFDYRDKDLANPDFVADQ